jgi:hypothetical protein
MTQLSRGDMSGMLNGLGGSPPNMNGSMEGLDGDGGGGGGLSKSAFMDLGGVQQGGGGHQGPLPGMHPAYSSIRTSYPSHNPHHPHQHDSVFSTPQHRASHLGYPFSMNPMGGSYSAPPSHFAMSPYGTTPSPPLRDGE